VVTAANAARINSALRAGRAAGASASSATATARARATVPSSSWGACRVGDHHYYYSNGNDAYNRFGSRLWSDYLRLDWCWGYATTYVHAAWTDHHISETTLGSLVGWDFKGVTVADDYPYTYRYRNGGYAARRTDEWRFCTTEFHVICVQTLFPWVHDYAHFDGTWVTSTGGM
jgi:hypothetical protein